MEKLSEVQIEAVLAVANGVAGQGLGYVLTVFDAEGLGAVFSNIDPGQAVEALEDALRAARSKVSPGEMAGTLQ